MDKNKIVGNLMDNLVTMETAKLADPDGMDSWIQGEKDLAVKLGLSIEEVEKIHDKAKAFVLA